MLPQQPCVFQRSIANKHSTKVRSMDALIGLKNKFLFVFVIIRVKNINVLPCHVRFKIAHNTNSLLIETNQIKITADFC